MEPRDITYKILVDEETNEMQFFLDEQPWKFVDPKNIKIGSMIWFDPNGLNRSAVVTGIRQGDFLYYDAGTTDRMEIEEIAMFQVYKAVTDDEEFTND